MAILFYCKVVWTFVFCYINSHGNSRWQSAIAEGFAEASSVFIVITLAKILPRWLFPSQIIFGLQFLTHILTKLLFTNKRCHSHVLEKCLYVPQEVRSILYFRQFYHSLSLHSQWNKRCFYAVYHCIGEILWRHIFKQLSFCFILLPFVHLPASKKSKTCDMNKSYLYKFFF